MKKVIMIHHKPDTTIIAGKDVFNDREVRVMAVAEGWAMVRRKGAMPYICPEKELTPNPKGKE